MTKDQRMRIVFWGILGLLGMVRAVYAVIEGNTFGLIFGVLWCALGGYKAWSEAKRVDEQTLGRRPSDR